MKKLLIVFIILLIPIAIIGIYLFLNRNNPTQNQASELILEVINSKREVYQSYTEVSISAPTEVELKDGPQTSIFKIGEKDGKHHYIARVNDIPGGTTTRTLIFSGTDGSQAEVNLELTMVKITLPFGYDSIDAWEGSSYIINPDILSIVDKKNRLPEDYYPNEVVDLNKTFGIYTFNDAKLTSEAGNQLKVMWNALGKEIDDYITVASGYRSWPDQLKIYSNNLIAYGEAANDFSARPGHSEHQLGTTVDFTNKEVEYKLVEAFGNTEAYKWLKENSYKYGFVESYPKADQAETGFYEPWQFRYIGVENAKEVHDSGKTFYQWLKTK